MYTLLNLLKLVNGDSDFFTDSKWDPTGPCYAAIRGANGSPNRWRDCCNVNVNIGNCTTNLYNTSKLCFGAITNNFDDVKKKYSIWYNCCDEHCYYTRVCEDDLYCPLFKNEDHSWLNWVIVAVTVTGFALLASLLILVWRIRRRKRKRKNYRKPDTKPTSMYNPCYECTHKKSMYLTDSDDLYTHGDSNYLEDCTHCEYRYTSSQTMTLVTQEKRSCYSWSPAQQNGSVANPTASYAAVSVTHSTAVVPHSTGSASHAEVTGQTNALAAPPTASAARAAELAAHATELAARATELAARATESAARSRELHYRESVIGCAVACQNANHDDSVGTHKKYRSALVRGGDLHCRDESR